MSASTRPDPSEDQPPEQPGGKPVHSPVDLPVEPDLGPVPPIARPEDPGVTRPIL